MEGARVPLDGLVTGATRDNAQDPSFMVQTAASFVGVIPTTQKCVIHGQDSVCANPDSQVFIATGHVLFTLMAQDAIVSAVVKILLTVRPEMVHVNVHQDGWDQDVTNLVKMVNMELDVNIAASVPMEQGVNIPLENVNAHQDGEASTVTLHVLLVVGVLSVVSCVNVTMMVSVIISQVNAVVQQVGRVKDVKFHVTEVNLVLVAPISVIVT